MGCITHWRVKHRHKALSFGLNSPLDGDNDNLSTWLSLISFSMAYMALYFVSAGCFHIVDATLWNIWDFFWWKFQNPKVSNNKPDHYWVYFGSTNLPVAESPFKWPQSCAYLLILPPFLNIFFSKNNLTVVSMCWKSASFFFVLVFFCWLTQILPYSS